MLHDLQLSHDQKLFSYVSQDSMLIDKILIRNFIAEEEYSSDSIKKVKAVLEDVGLISWLEEQPKGVMADIGEHGCQL